MTVVILSVFPLILTALLHIDLINVAYLMAYVFCQVIMTLPFLYEVVNEVESIFPSLVLVQPRKTPPCLTERLLMGHKESNQTMTLNRHKNH